MKKLNIVYKKGVLLIAILTLFIKLFNITSYSSTGVPASTSNNFLESLKPFMLEYKTFLNFFIGFVLLTNIIIFIYHFCQLGAKACNHPLIRQQTIHNILICGVCLALIGGGATIYYILFYMVMG